ncbi:hypothetical protein DFH07DRAFT_780603 [Mycena maculata]|uniref:No apical meristem-associated C-terminal domain-containing protein n=1 Tax=Mycena maculata TaxID=230809 RepID=A0AAD7MVB4_9AGAR|nr:hypothetical protein DFH07DRAFT_780603 [Mycena maculata]
MTPRNLPHGKGPYTESEGRPEEKNKGKKKADESSDDSEIEDGGPPVPNFKYIDIDWKDPALREKLIALIMENKYIKQALYPPCGPNASTTNGGGKTKYKEVIAACNTPKKQLGYANRIKNRMRTMAKITHGFDTEMGQMSAGIQHSSEIDMSVTNQFTTKWAEISAVCPWFFDISTGFDTGVVMPGLAAVDDDGDEDAEEEADEDNTSSIPFSRWGWEHTPEPDTGHLGKRSFSEIDGEGGEDGLAGSSDAYNPSSPVISELALLDDLAEPDNLEKVKAKGQETHRKNTAKPSTSAPTVTPAPSAPKPAKKSKIAEFSEIVKNEEKTRQKEIELASLRTHQAIETTAVKAWLIEQRKEGRQQEKKGRQEERMAKLRMKELKMCQSHELRMRGASSSSSASHTPSFFDTHSASSGSHYTPLEPPDYTDRFDFTGNATAGPSTGAGEFDFDPPTYNPDHEDNASLSLCLRSLRFSLPAWFRRGAAAGAPFASESDDEERPSWMKGSAMTASSSLSESDGVFRADAHHRYVIVKFFITWEKAKRLLIWCDDPFFNLKAIDIEPSLSTLDEFSGLEQRHMMFS